MEIAALGGADPVFGADRAVQRGDEPEHGVGDVVGLVVERDAGDVHVHVAVTRVTEHPHRRVRARPPSRAPERRG